MFSQNFAELLLFVEKPFTFECAIDMLFFVTYLSLFRWPCPYGLFVPSALMVSLVFTTQQFLYRSA